MPPNFGFTPPTVQELAAKGPPPKKSLPAHLIPNGAIHVVDGWVFKRLADGAVQVFVMSTDTGGPKATTVLTPAEWAQVRDLVEPPAAVANQQPAVPPQAKPLAATPEALQALAAQVMVLQAQAAAASDVAKPAVVVADVEPQG
jgi:hypothetical protein